MVKGDDVRSEKRLTLIMGGLGCFRCQCVNEFFIVYSYCLL